jgi:hypothetical protein
MPSLANIHCYHKQRDPTPIEMPKTDEKPAITFLEHSKTEMRDFLLQMIDQLEKGEIDTAFVGFIERDKKSQNSEVGWYIIGPFDICYVLGLFEYCAWQLKKRVWPLNC